MGDSAWFRPTRHMKQEVDKPGYNPENRNSTITTSVKTLKTTN
jgi:hypothetical protein